jgi:hypothetical protein
VAKAGKADVSGRGPDGFPDSGACLSRVPTARPVVAGIPGRAVEAHVNCVVRRALPAATARRHDGPGYFAERLPDTPPAPPKRFPGVVSRPSTASSNGCLTDAGLAFAMLFG